MAHPSTRTTWTVFAALLAAFLITGTAVAVGGDYPPLVNFPVAPRLSHQSGGVRTLGDITSPAYPVFVDLCRQYDSRNFTPLADGVNRAITLTGAPCNINASAAGVSLNITVFNISGQTANAVFKVGTVSPPTTAWINWAPGVGQIANAGSLPLSAAKQIFFQVAMGGGQLDFTIDVNAYYINGAAGTLTTGEFFGVYGDFGNSLLFSRNSNTGSGANAIRGVQLGTAAGSAGVIGQQAGGSGANFGVLGTNGSGTDGMAGVKGTGGQVGVLGFGTFRGVDGHGTVTGSCGTCGEGFASTSSSGVTGVAGVAGADALFGIGNFTATGAKSFIDPYPGDPTKQINYIALEGPTAGTFFNGRATAVNGVARIAVPDHFRAVTDPGSLTVQATPIGQMARFAVLKVGIDEILIQASSDVDFFYTVNGVRANFRDHNPIEDNRVFRPDPAGGVRDIRNSISDTQKQVLIQNQVLNADGTWNKATVERLGWSLPPDSGSSQPSTPLKPDNKTN